MMTYPVLAAFLLLAGPAEAAEVPFDGQGHAYHPVWSHDGRFLAFEVNRYAMDVDLYISSVTGDAAKAGVRIALVGSSNPFGGSGQVVVNPAWHKDGYTVFEASNQGGQYRIYVTSPGGQPSELISTAEVPGDLTFPTVSPDGRFLAFVADQTGAGDMRVRDTQTNKLTQLTATPVAEMFPMFSSDTQRILFTRKNNGSEDVYELAIATKVETQLATGNGDQTRPNYAADGRIVFFDGSRGDDRWDLVSAIKGTKTTLARDVRLPLRARPALSPDGKWVAFSFSDPTQNHKVVFAAVDGSKMVEIPTTFTACGEPALAKQNGRILLAFTALPSTRSDWRFLVIQDVTEKLQ